MLAKIGDFTLGFGGKHTSPGGKIKSTMTLK